MTGLAGTICLVILLAAQPCFAFKAGAVEVDPFATVSETYDDNVTYNNDNTKADFITSTTVGANAVYEGKTRRVSLRAYVRNQGFARNPDYSYTSEEFTVNLAQELTRYDRLSLSNVFLHSEDPASFEDEFGRTSGRYSYIRNRFNLDYTKDFTKQLSGLAGFSMEHYNYSRSSQVDSGVYGFKLVPAYALSSADSVSLIYQFLYRDYARGTDYATNRLGVGWRHYFSTQFYLDSTIGEDFILPSGGEDSTTAGYFAFSAVDEIDAATNLSLNFVQQDSSTSYSQALRSSWQVSAALAKDLTERLGTDLSCFFGKGTYESPDIEDDFRGVTAGIRWELLKDLKMNFAYSFSQTDSNIDSRRYEKNRLSLGLTYDF